MKNNKKSHLFVLISLAFLLLVNMVAIPYILKIKKPDSSNYLANENMNFIFDNCHYLDDEELQKMSVEVEKTYGSIYKVVYWNDSSYDVKESISKLEQEIRNKNLFPSAADEYKDTVIIAHNLYKNEYVLYPLASLLDDSNLFPDIKEQSVGAIALTIPVKLALEKSENYSELLEGTPSAVYSNVFQYLTQNGYSESEIANRLDNFTSVNNRDFTILKFVPLLLIDCIVIAGISIITSAFYSKSKWG